MSKNDITGDDIKSRVVTKEFRESFDRIFGKKIVCQRCGKTLLPENYIHTCSPKKQEESK